MTKLRDRLLSVVLCIVVGVMMLTFSIGLPIYIRPFYYAHIEPLGIPETTHYTVAEICAAYDEVLDYLTLPNRPFGTGVFRHSESGMAHFADCKVLFALNFWAFVVSAAVVITLYVLHKTHKIRLCRPWGYSLPCVTGGVMLILCAMIGGVCALDFETAFETFHTLFFAGKDNWLFSAKKDEIILALPQKFFMHCAIFIVASVVVISLIMLIVGIVYKQKKVKLKERL